MRRWTFAILVLFLLTGCGQPLQVRTTPRVTRTLIAAQTAIPTGLSSTAGTNPTAEPTENIPTNLVEATPTTSETASIAPTATSIPLSPTPLPPTAIPTVTLTPTPAIVVVPQPVDTTNEQRWRAQQLERTVIEPPRLYTARSHISLYWYDPTTGQTLEIGTLVGDFPVQAQFTFRPKNAPALEVPYRINTDFGLTAISEILKQRMNNAGYEQSVEAFVLVDERIIPKQ